uniref:BRCT domain-containing protein n=1 Tax=Plectus sambesii TaxID=2011161 RepID=A0A914XB30_9BILA
MSIQLQGYDPSGAVASADTEDSKERVYSLAQAIQKVGDVDEQSAVDEFPPEEDATANSEALRQEAESLARLRTLFASCRFFLNREVPKEALTFIVRCCGGMTSWALGPGATYSEEDQRITHQIIDRPKLQGKKISRLYAQPQWIFDCFNARRRLPIERYFPGAALPPHLSPFVEERAGDYVPPERLDQLRHLGHDVDNLIAQKEEKGPSSAPPTKKKRGILPSSKTGTDEGTADTPAKPQMAVEPGQLHRDNKQKSKNEEGQELKMREMMIAKKHRRVYHKIKRGTKRHAREVDTLKRKRAQIDAGN